MTSVKVSHGKKNVSVTINFANLQRLDQPTDSSIANTTDVSIEFVRKSTYNLGGGLDPTLVYRDSFGSEGADPAGGRMSEGGVRHGGEFDQVCGVSQGDDPDDQPYDGLPQFKVDVKYGKNGYYKVQMPRACVLNESKIKASVAVGGYTNGVGYRDVVSSKAFKTAEWTDWLLKG